MQYKLGKFWSVLGFSALALTAAPSAMAMTVSIASPNVPNAVGGSLPQSFFFPTNASGLDPVGGYGIVNLADTTDPQITFNVSTTAGTVPTGIPNTSSSGTDTESYLMVSIANTASANPVPVPLLNCTGNGNCGGFYGTNNYGHAILIQPNQTIQVTINLYQACMAWNAIYTSYPIGCNTFVNSAFTTGTSGTAFFASSPFVFGVYSTTGATLANMGAVQGAGITAAQTTSADTGTATLNFNGTSPETGGPAPTPLSTPPVFYCNNLSSYQAGDGQVIIDGSQFSYGTPGVVTNNPSGAPDGLAMVGLIAQYVPGQGPFTPADIIAPTITTEGSLATVDGIAPINARFLPIAGQIVSGFQNSTQSNHIMYQAGFIGVDNYGYLMDAVSPSNLTASTCAFPNALETAAIQGFLQSSKCFIATAAFRTGDSAPLVLLRAFRDQFLEQFKLGQGFVHWYYRWSPAAAEWLVENPEFRYPVLLALIPLQLIAWTVLHPLVLSILSLFGIVLLVSAVTSRRRPTREWAE